MTHQILRTLGFFTLVVSSTSLVRGQEFVPRPADDFYQDYKALVVKKPSESPLRKGDRLAICGDSITEQKMYSRIMETYLTACVPQMEVTCRQFGWSGERADGFARRMANDVLRFKPTLATTCYGMNDHGYTPFNPKVGQAYRENMAQVIKTFKQGGCRVVAGSPGTIHSVPGWVKSATGTWKDLNLSLLQLRNIGVETAAQEDVFFADVFWPMLTASHTAIQKYGEEFKIEGKDGVHPGWAGSAVMAFAFLDSLGLDGHIGTISVDLASGQAHGTEGHQVTAGADGACTIVSQRYPYETGAGDLAKDDNVRAAWALVPFDEKLNRFLLKVAGATAAEYDVTWGQTTQTFSGKALTEGVNLAAAFSSTPFSEAFSGVWNAVGDKQAYETRAMKELMHGQEGKVDMEGTVALTQKVVDKFAGRVVKAMKPVTHKLVIKAKS